MADPKAQEFPWYFRYPLAIGLIALAIHLGNQPKTSAWLVAALVLFGVLMMYEALFLLIFAVVCFYFFRALAAIPVTLATLFWLWLIFGSERK